VSSPASSPPAVSCRGLTKVYAGAQAVVALDRLDLDVPAGQFLALVGESGSGKSTLLHLLGGIDRPTGGRIDVGGRDLGALPEHALVLYRRRDVGMIFQFFNLLPHLTVRENVELPRRLDGAAGAADAETRALASSTASAWPTAPARTRTSSRAGDAARRGGPRARGRRPAAPADEPTGNLDSRNGAAVWACWTRSAGSAASPCCSPHTPRRPPRAPTAS
jgi:putative ABC transport system ATP-binding protein